VNKQLTGSSDMTLRVQKRSVQLQQYASIRHCNDAKVNLGLSRG
jgi:hypothetical protein